jgi:hypothetical protein
MSLELCTRTIYRVAGKFEMTVSVLHENKIPEIVNSIWNIPNGVSVTKIYKISSHNQHTFMNMFIKQCLVLAPNYGHHKAVIQKNLFSQISKTVSDQNNKY